MSKDIKEVLEAYHLARNKYDEDVSVPQGEALAEIKRIIEEAKPGYDAVAPQTFPFKSSDRDMGIDEYHNNLMKALGE